CSPGSGIKSAEIHRRANQVWSRASVWKRSSKPWVHTVFASGIRRHTLGCDSTCMKNVIDTNCLAVTIHSNIKWRMLDFQMNPKSGVPVHRQITRNAHQVQEFTCMKTKNVILFWLFLATTTFPALGQSAGTKLWEFAASPRTFVDPMTGEIQQLPAYIFSSPAVGAD